MENIIGKPLSLWYDKEQKTGELEIATKDGTRTVKVFDWNSAKYMFWYTDKEVAKGNYAKDILNPFLAHGKEDQLEESRFHFGKRSEKSRDLLFRVEGDELWCHMTTNWKPLTTNDIKGLLPATAWEVTSIEPTERHGGMITYNYMFEDSTTAIVTIDAGILDGRHAMNIKGRLIGELGEIVIDKHLRYRHTDKSQLANGLIETLDAMNKLHDMLPNVSNIIFNVDMLGKEKLPKDIQSKLTNGITVYSALAILKEAGKKSVAGAVLLAAAKSLPEPIAPTIPEPAEYLPEPKPEQEDITIPPDPEVENIPEEEEAPSKRKSKYNFAPAEE